MVLRRKKEIPSQKIVEPVTNLLDEGKYFRVITELPGIAEEKICIDLEKTVLAISATEEGSGKKYKKLIALPFESRLDKKKFQKGILDLTLEKTNSAYE
jgi:HSP20 family molecular chaperone IbpA